MNILLIKKLSPYAIAFILVAFGMYKAEQFGERRIRAEWDAQKIQDEKAVIKQLADLQVKLVAQQQQTAKAEEDKNVNQAIIDSLHDHIVSLPSTHIPINRCAVSAGGSSVPDTSGAARIFSEQLDKSFADLQSRIGKIIERCDQLNVDAIELNAKTR